MAQKLTPLYKRILNAEYIHRDNDADYAIEYDKEHHTLYLLFEWSNSDLDWFSNLDFPAKPYKNGKDKWFVHRGFLRVWKTIKDEVEAKVKEYLSTVYVAEIICAGYSHGAAIAGLATEDMEYLFTHEWHIPLYNDFVPVRGYGFGCPRFAWGKLPKDVAYRFRHFHVVRNCCDLVTHVPPVLFGFHHVGELIEIGQNGGYAPIESHYPEKYALECMCYDRDLDRYDVR